jgi:hypothetical protein
MGVDVKRVGAGPCARPGTCARRRNSGRPRGGAPTDNGNNFERRGGSLCPPRNTGHPRGGAPGNDEDIFERRGRPMCLPANADVSGRTRGCAPTAECGGPS